MTPCDRCRTSPAFSTFANESLLAERPAGRGPSEQVGHVRLCDVCVSDRLLVGRGPCFYEAHPGFASPTCNHPDHVAAAVLDP